MENKQALPGTWNQLIHVQELVDSAGPGSPQTVVSGQSHGVIICRLLFRLSQVTWPRESSLRLLNPGPVRSIGNLGVFPALMISMWIANEPYSTPNARMIVKL